MSPLGPSRRRDSYIRDIKRAQVNDRHTMEAASVGSFAVRRTRRLGVWCLVVAVLTLAVGATWTPLHTPHLLPGQLGRPDLEPVVVGRRGRRKSLHRQRNGPTVLLTQFYRGRG